MRIEGRITVGGKEVMRLSDELDDDEWSKCVPSGFLRIVIGDFSVAAPIADMKTKCGQPVDVGLADSLPTLGTAKRCCKCGYARDEPSMKFSGARNAVIRTCLRCSYQWDEACKDSDG